MIARAVTVACDDPKKLEDLKIAFLFVANELLKIYIFSGLTHLVLKRLRQPSVISQYIAGLIVGSTMTKWAHTLEVEISTMREFMDKITWFGSYLFMFLIGLEMDFAYLRLLLRRSSYIAAGGIVACIAVFSPAFMYLFNHLAQPDASKFIFFVVGALFVSSTASPVLIRIVTELKLTSSNIGRLAITSGFITDLVTVTIFAAFSVSKATNYAASKEARVAYWIGMVLVLVAAFVGIPLAARIINRTNEKKRYISSMLTAIFIALLFAICIVAEKTGFSGTTLSFLIGLLMPREGPTTRTMLDKLQYLVHNILLPLYFTETAARTDLAEVYSSHNGLHMIGMTLLVTLIGTIGKVFGTVVVTTQFLKIPVKEGLVLGMLLNVKGYLDVMLLQIGTELHIWKDKTTQAILVMAVILSTFMAGPVSSLIVWWQRKAYTYQAQSLQNLGVKSQLRVLACVHGPRDVQPMLNLVSLCRGDGTSLVAAFVQHLIELTQKYTVTLMYHQKTSDGADLDYGGDIVRQVSVAVDMVTREMRLPAREMTAISQYENMHKDVCMGAEDIRASIILIPFHKEQRYDGRMVCRKEGRRHLNNKVIQHAPCTIGILVDRPISSAGMASSRPNSNSSAKHNTVTTDPGTPTPSTPNGAYVGAYGPVNKVVAIFFGGPDDREAASFMVRMATNPLVEATLVRFLPESSDAHSKMGSSRCASEIAMVIQDEDDIAADEEFISNFHQCYVETGVVMFVERYVKTGLETVTALSVMAGMYSLFIVGRVGPHLSLMMGGMRDWEECPELGPIGDLLASEDFMDSGSVLIIQQHSLTKRTQLLGAENE